MLICHPYYDQYLASLRSGAVWLTQDIDQLRVHGEWDIRSGAIPYHFAPDLASLAQWSKYGKETSHVFQKELQSKIYANSKGLYCMQLSVPCITFCYSQGLVPLEKVCKHLHCDLRAAGDDLAKYYKQYNPAASHCGREPHSGHCQQSVLTEPDGDNLYPVSLPPISSILDPASAFCSSHQPAPPNKPACLEIEDFYRPKRRRQLGSGFL
ncbi:hypothetical protein MAP00_009273 [Monascus purpureus]|nr:hypothetical protein MAP00_009273 [Monascus purpureus]